jgi:hypothetical protein
MIGRVEWSEAGEDGVREDEARDSLTVLFLTSGDMACLTPFFFPLTSDLFLKNGAAATSSHEACSPSAKTRKPDCVMSLYSSS